jgi:hypothetical protein
LVKSLTSDDDPGDLAVSFDHPHSRRRDGGTVVGTHRRRLSANPSNVHVESSVHDALDDCHVGRTRPANLHVDHRADGRALRYMSSTEVRDRQPAAHSSTGSRPSV